MIAPAILASHIFYGHGILVLRFAAFFMDYNISMKEKDLITIDINGINSEGEGIGRVDRDGGDFVVFVPGAITGERVTCRLDRVSRKYAAASIVDILSASPQRTKARCPSYGLCGGCQLQHVTYEEQLRIKGDILNDAMRRIGHITTSCEVVCSPSPDEWGYRNKTVLPVGRKIGYYERRSHRIVGFEHCPVLEPSVERIVSEMITANASSGLRGYDERNAKGDIRGMAARAGGGMTLAGTIAARELTRREFGRLRDIHQRMMSNSRGVAGSVLNIKTGRDNFVWGPVFRTICGGGSLSVPLGKYSFSVDISAFFQINTAQAERIFERAAETAGQLGASRVLELYGGVGSLTAYVASVAESVDSVEEWRSSARLMRENMESNGIENVRVFESSSEAFLSRYGHERAYDTIVLDPPRTGASEAVINGVSLIAPQNIIYISCNPATLARDAARLMEDNRYEVTRLEAYDMFPQTSHVESLCVLEKTE